MLEKLILGMLLYKNLTIYDMKKALDEGINQFFTTSFGALHPAVNKLMDRGFTDAVKVLENGRAKKVYSLTDSGKAYFLEWLEKDISMSKVQEEGLLRVFFYKELSKRKQISLLQKYVNEMKERVVALKHIKAFQQTAKKEIPKKYVEAFNYRVTTIDFGLGYYTFAIEWYERLIDDIAAGRMAK